MKLKSFFRAACLVLAAALIIILPGCKGEDAAKPKLQIVYVAGNETETFDAAGRINSLTSVTVTGTSTKNYAWEEPLRPTEIAAKTHDGTLRLAFSYTSGDYTIYMTDTETSETETVTGNKLSVTGGRSYSFTVSGSWTAGKNTYDMEFAFDLVYTVSQAPKPPDAPSVTPQPVKASDAQPSAVPEPSPEPSPQLSESERKSFDSPPKLTINYNGTAVQPAMGTTSWQTDGQAFEADSTHPMQWDSFKTVQRVYPYDDLEFSFEYQPDEYKITLWNEKFLDESPEDYDAFFQTLEENKEEITLADGAMTLGTGYNTGYIIMVEATWDYGPKGDTGTWGGSTVFAFRVSPTNY